MQINLNTLKKQRQRVLLLYKLLYYKIQTVLENEAFDEYIQIYKTPDNKSLYPVICFDDLNLDIAILPNCLNRAGGFGIIDNRCYISFSILTENMDVRYVYGIAEALCALLYTFTQHHLAILHELVHFDDYKNGLIKDTDSSNSDNIYAYYNNPIEFRAYLQETLFTIEEDFVLNYGKRKKYTRKELDEYFDLFIKNRKNERENLNLPQYKYLTEENYNRLLDICKRFVYSHLK